jgi:Zn-dependent peptidase ImmA (M78 family)
MSLRNDIDLIIKATQLREEMGIRSTDPISIHQILKCKGILGYFKPLGKDLSGMAIKVQAGEREKSKYFMLVNTNDPYCKQRFTAAHELYHLLIQKDFHYSYDKDIYGSKDKEEVNANYFATYLLLPDAGVRQMIPIEEQKKDKVTIATLLKLEHNFRCSRLSLLYRLRYLGIITEKFIDSHKNNIKADALEYGYDTSLYLPDNRSELVGDYNIKARELYDKGMISQAKYYSYLRDMNINIMGDEDAEKSNID